MAAIENYGPDDYSALPVDLGQFPNYLLNVLHIGFYTSKIYFPISVIEGIDEEGLSVILRNNLPNLGQAVKLLITNGIFTHKFSNKPKLGRQFLQFLIFDLFKQLDKLWVDLYQNEITPLFQLIILISKTISGR